METRDAVIARWCARRDEWKRLGMFVDAAAIAGEIVADLSEIVSSEAMEVLTLTEAARRSGYSAGHLGREIRAGRIPNAGRLNAPRLLVRDLPRRAGVFHPAHSMAILRSPKRRVAVSVVHSTQEHDDG